MAAGSPLAFTLLRLPRGAGRPSEDDFRRALEEDRAKLRLPRLNGAGDFEVTGPHPIIVDGQELDEWVVWEK